MGRDLSDGIAENFLDEQRKGMEQKRREPIRDAKEWNETEMDSDGTAKISDDLSWKGNA